MIRVYFSIRPPATLDDVRHVLDDATVDYMENVERQYAGSKLSNVVFEINGRSDIFILKLFHKKIDGAPAGIDTSAQYFIGEPIYTGIKVAMIETI